MPLVKGETSKIKTWISRILCCIYLILTKFDLVRFTNLLDFWSDKRQRYVKRMETKLEYLLDSVTTLNTLKIQKYWNKNLHCMGICIEKYTA